MLWTLKGKGRKIQNVNVSSEKVTKHMMSNGVNVLKIPFPIRKFLNLAFRFVFSFDFSFSSSLSGSVPPLPIDC